MTDADTLTVGLELPSAQRLADQITTIKDLQFVMECWAAPVRAGQAGEEQDGVVPQALWSAALTAYDRCFARGKKFGLTTDDVKSLPLEGQVVKFHEWAVSERTSSASTPPTRSTRPGWARCWPTRIRPAGRCAASPCCRPATSWSTGPGSGSLGALASELAKQTAEKAQKQESVVAADAQQLGLDKLYTMTPLLVGAPSDEKPSPSSESSPESSSGDGSAGEWLAKPVV